jgi:hypothetical protein
MKPSRLQYILAHGFRLSTWGSSIILTVALAWALFFDSALPIGGLPTFWYALLLLPTVLLGWFLGGLVLWPIVASVASRLNGAPFDQGDRVRILVGQHRDQVVRVYEVWKERNQLRVDLGERETEDVQDVFSFHQVCREKS